MLFADDADLTALTQDALQRLVTCSNRACIDFGRMISENKTEVMCDDARLISQISLGDHKFEDVDDSTYLRSNMRINFSQKCEPDIRIGESPTAIVRLAKRV